MPDVRGYDGTYLVTPVRGLFLVEEKLCRGFLQTQSSRSSDCPAGPIMTLKDWMLNTLKVNAAMGG